MSNINTNFGSTQTSSYYNYMEISILIEENEFLNALITDSGTFRIVKDFIKFCNNYNNPILIKMLTAICDLPIQEIWKEGEFSYLFKEILVNDRLSEIHVPLLKKLFDWGSYYPFSSTSDQVTHQNMANFLYNCPSHLPIPLKVQDYDDDQMQNTYLFLNDLVDESRITIERYPG